MSEDVLSHRAIDGLLSICLEFEWVRTDRLANCSDSVCNRGSVLCFRVFLNAGFLVNKTDVPLGDLSADYEYLADLRK